jgi:hypothetical protein
MSPIERPDAVARALKGWLAAVESNIAAARG